MYGIPDPNALLRPWSNLKEFSEELFAMMRPVAGVTPQRNDAPLRTPAPNTVGQPPDQPDLINPTYSATLDDDFRLRSIQGNRTVVPRRKPTYDTGPGTIYKPPTQPIPEINIPQLSEFRAAQSVQPLPAINAGAFSPSFTVNFQQQAVFASPTFAAPAHALVRPAQLPLPEFQSAVQALPVPTLQPLVAAAHPVQPFTLAPQTPIASPAPIPFQSLVVLDTVSSRTPLAAHAPVPQMPLPPIPVLPPTQAISAQHPISFPMAASAQSIVSPSSPTTTAATFAPWKERTYQATDQLRTRLPRKWFEPPGVHPPFGPIAGPGGGGGGAAGPVIGQVVEGTGNNYHVIIYSDGPDNAPDNDGKPQDVKIIEIDPSDTIPPGTWLFGILLLDDSGGNPQYYAQPPIWLP